MKKRMVICVLSCCVFALFMFTGLALSAEYPDKSIEFVTHSAAGGGADVFIRTVALILNNEGIVKPKIQVLNKTGGAATVAINYVAAKKGDPYVIQTWTTSPLVTVLRGTTMIKSPLEMSVICNLTEDPSMVVVKADSKYKDFKELIADAKKNPKKINCGINSQGGTEHITAARIQRATGVEFNITSFPVSTTALLGGHIDFCFGNVEETGEHIKANKLRAIAAVGDRRTNFLPNLPTMKEQGVNASFVQVRGFWGPPEMPDYAIKFWEQAFAKLMETKAFKDYMKSVEMDPAYVGSEASKKFVADYAKQLAQDLKELAVYGGKK
jgi:putative tricarboxylic transport membrane protein